jgi:hypothetical protein
LLRPVLSDKIRSAIASAPQLLSTWVARDGWAIALFGIAAMLAMYPVMTSFSKQILGWPGGDNVQYVYMTGWVAKALANSQSPLVDPHLNYPGKLLLSATDVPLLSMIALAAVTRLFNPISSYNLMILLAHMFSGYFTYLWVRKLTDSRFGGTIAGLLFLLSPFRIAHSYGHLQLVSTQFLPLFFWALDSALQTDGVDSRQVWLLFLTTFLVGSMSQYYLFISLIAGTGYIFFSLIGRKGHLLAHGSKVVAPLVVGAMFSAWPYLQTLHQTPHVPYPLALIRKWSASGLDFFVPSRLHPFWGEAMERLYPRSDWIEFLLYLGAVGGMLALVGLFDKDGRHTRRKWTWLALALIGLMLALGTDLHMGGKPLQQQDPFWLPAYYLAHLPYLDLMRVWSRFTIVPIFCLAMLAGIGAAFLQKRFGWRWPMMLLAIALVFLDLAPGRLTAAPLQPRPIDMWLAKQPGDFAVAFLPPGFDNNIAMYGSLLHEKRLPAYNHPRHDRALYRLFYDYAINFPSPESIKLFQLLELKYLIIHKNSYDGKNLPDWKTVEASITSSGVLKLLAVLDPFVIVSVNSSL